MAIVTVPVSDKLVDLSLLNNRKKLPQDKDLYLCQSEVKLFVYANFKCPIVNKPTLYERPLPSPLLLVRNKQDQKDLINLPLCRSKLSAKVKV